MVVMVEAKEKKKGVAGKRPAKKPVEKPAVEKAAAKTIEKQASAVAGKAEKKPRARAVGEKASAGLKQRLLSKPRIWFRGRFGKKSIWKKSKAKWQKWRRPRGIDIHRTQEDGRFVKIGYRLPRQIRDYHPSGFKEALVKNLGDILALKGTKGVVVRISSGLGAKKRKQVFLEAKKIGLRTINK